MSYNHTTWGFDTHDIYRDPLAGCLPKNKVVQLRTENPSTVDEFEGVDLFTTVVNFNAIHSKAFVRFTIGKEMKIMMDKKKFVLLIGNSLTDAAIWRKGKR